MKLEFILTFQSNSTARDIVADHAIRSSKLTIFRKSFEEQIRVLVKVKQWKRMVKCVRKRSKNSAMKQQVYVQVKTRYFHNIPLTKARLLFRFQSRTITSAKNPDMQLCCIGSVPSISKINNIVSTARQWTLETVSTQLGFMSSLSKTTIRTAKGCKQEPDHTNTNEVWSPVFQPFTQLLADSGDWISLHQESHWTNHSFVC